MNAMETLLMMTERYERLMTDRDTIGYHGDAGGLSQYVSVVTFCGQPILPPVVSLHLPFCCIVLNCTFSAQLLSRHVHYDITNGFFNV